MQTSSNDKELSVGRVLEVLRKRKWYLILTTLLVAAGAILYALGQPDRYRSDALLTAEPTVPDYVKGELPGPQQNIQDKLWLIRENVLIPPVLETVIQEYHLDQKQPPTSFVQRGADQIVSAWENATQSLPFFKKEKTEVGDGPRQELLEDIKKKVTIQVEAPDAFVVGFEGRTREEAMDVSNRLSQLLVERTAEDSNQSATWTADFMKTEVDEVKQKLDAQNEAIRRFQSASPEQAPGRTDIDARTLATLREQLHAKIEQISDDQARRAAVEQEMKDLNNQIPPETEEKSADEIRLAEQRAKLAQMETVYTDQFPEIKNLKAEIRNLETSVATNKPTAKKVRTEPTPSQLHYLALKGEVESIDRRLQSSQRQQAGLAAQIASYERRLDAAPQSERASAALTRDYELTRAQYQSLLEKQSQAQMNARLSRVNQNTVFRVVRPALLPVEPSEPKRGRIVLIGLLAGLGLGMGLAVFAEFRDTSYHSADEFRDSTSLPILTVIPSLGASPFNAVPSGEKRERLSIDSNDSERKALAAVLHDPRSLASEQYGLLAMEVRERLGRESSKVLCVTSAAGGEGKTLTSLNLSLALCRTMEGRVLLLESDLRRPRLQEYLGFGPRKGFSDLLKDSSQPIEPYIFRMNGLSVLPGGPVLEDPLKLLSSQRAKDVFTRLRKMFDFIVVDAPPIVPIADSHVLAGLSDGVIIVVRARQTRRELLEHALRSFHVSNLLGAVLNGVDLQRSPYYYAYNYYTTGPRRLGA